MNSGTRLIEKEVLPNGLVVITEPMAHVRSVSVGIWIRGGSRREPAAMNGISHFIEHMVFKGTEQRSAEEIARAVDRVGGMLDAFTSREMVCFNTRVLDEHLPAVFDIIADLVLCPLFAEEEIPREKHVILEEIKMVQDNPEDLVHETLSQNFWNGHALGRPILGTPETVEGLERVALRDWFRRWYAQADNPPAHAPHITQCDKRELEQVHICLGVPAYPMTDSRRFSAAVLNNLLGSGMSSRLFQNIREKQGLAYAVFSEMSPYRDAGMLSVYAGTAIETAERLVRSVVAEFQNLKEQPVSEEELRRAKDHLKGAFLLSLEASSARMSNLARHHIYFDRFFSSDELIAAIEAVTREEVQQVAQEFFRPESIAATVVGNLNGFALTRDQLTC
jgi:predicted Zn-dependent peptidase